MTGKVDAHFLCVCFFVNQIEKRHLREIDDFAGTHPRCSFFLRSNNSVCTQSASVLILRPGEGDTWYTCACMWSQNYETGEKQNRLTESKEMALSPEKKKNEKQWRHLYTSIRTRSPRKTARIQLYVTARKKRLVWIRLKLQNR